MATMKILLFEDDPRYGPQILAAIEKELRQTGSVTRFGDGPLKKPDAGKSKPYEDILRERFEGSPDGNATLFLCDSDLSRNKSFPGLSEVVVSKVADKLGIPIALYARGEGQTELEKWNEWREG